MNRFPVQSTSGVPVLVYGPSGFALVATPIENFSSSTPPIAKYM